MEMKCRIKRATRQVKCELDKIMTIHLMKGEYEKAEQMLRLHALVGP